MNYGGVCQICGHIRIIRSRSFMTGALIGLLAGALGMGCIAPHDGGKVDPPSPTSDADKAVRDSLQLFSQNLSGVYRESAERGEADSQRAFDSQREGVRTAVRESFDAVNEYVQERIGGDKYTADEAATVFREVSEAYARRAVK